MSNDSVAFDRAADYYDRTRGFPPGVETDVAAMMAAAGGFTLASRVLEIGVGTGRIALPLSAHVGAYVGIDLARPMMDRLHAKRQRERIFLVQGDATRLPFPDDSFDGVVAVHIFHLIPGWHTVLDELVRVLRPGAPLVHGGNGRLLADTLLTVWRKATRETNETAGAIPTERRESFLPENGWRETGEARTLRFTVERSPEEFINQMEQRVFSSTWRMTDAQIERGIAALRAYVAKHYADPTQPETVEASFNAQAYLPPENSAE
ncbi:MAG: methyltransferase domain-containing protein [Anaerolineae bacterium]|nr:methyltransferase domain-containing protein [Anaerolineae bacterium]